MAFRKRNVGISQAPQDHSRAENTFAPNEAQPSAAQGTRPSPIDGRPVISTGTPSLDALLAGHSGLALGNSLLIEENGTTDYAGALVKNYTAEGVVQGHVVHVLGVPEAWGRELPGVAQDDVYQARKDASGRKEEKQNEKMKIAWRYQAIGEFGSESPSRRAPAVDRTPSTAPEPPNAPPDQRPFNHTFDLTKRLVHPNLARVAYIPLSPSPTTSPFTPMLQHLVKSLSATSSDVVHRAVVPALLNPAVYPPHASHPSHLLAFIHALRSLLRQHSTRLCVMLTLSISLYDRNTGMVRWIEHLLDGVIELTPFPHNTSQFTSSGASTKEEENPQGLVEIRKVPIFHERGGGGGAGKALGENMAFTVSRRKFEIKPFSLPPAEGDTEAQSDRDTGKTGQSKLMEF